MKFETCYVDVNPYLATGQQPVSLIERQLPQGHGTQGSLLRVTETGRCGTFWVPDGHLLASDSLSWSMTETGQYVRVPIEAYRTQEKALATLLGLALQIGMVAVDSLRQYTSDRPQVVTLLLGHECPVTEDGQAFRCFIGVAIRTK